jgi:hypothetical protein
MILATVASHNLCVDYGQLSCWCGMEALDLPEIATPRALLGMHAWQKEQGARSQTAYVKVAHHQPTWSQYARCH